MRYSAARCQTTWERQRASLLPRLQAGESPVQAILFNPLLAAAVDPSRPVPDTEPFETVLFDYEVCHPSGGAPYWAVSARVGRARDWLMETGPLSSSHDLSGTTPKASDALSSTAEQNPPPTEVGR